MECHCIKIVISETHRSLNLLLLFGPNDIGIIFKYTCTQDIERMIPKMVTSIYDTTPSPGWFVLFIVKTIPLNLTRIVFPNLCRNLLICNRLRGQESTTLNWSIEVVISLYFRFVAGFKTGGVFLFRMYPVGPHSSSESCNTFWKSTSIRSKCSSECSKRFPGW